MPPIRKRRRGRVPNYPMPAALCLTNRRKRPWRKRQGAGGSRGTNPWIRLAH